MSLDGWSFLAGAFWGASMAFHFCYCMFYEDSKDLRLTKEQEKRKKEVSEK